MDPKPLIVAPTRRNFLLATSMAATVGSRLFGQAPGIIRTDRPVAAQGVMSGDVVPGRAMIWSRSDRPSRMFVTWKVGDKGDVKR